MSYPIPNIGDMVRIPQNALLTANNKLVWLKMPEPDYGVVIDIDRTKWPKVYKVFIKGSIWDAAEDDVHLTEV